VTATVEMPKNETACISPVQIHGQPLKQEGCFVSWSLFIHHKLIGKFILIEFRYVSPNLQHQFCGLLTYY